MTPYNSYHEERLLSLLKESDEAAFTEIYNRYWEKLLIVAMHRLAEIEEAREIVQDIFYRLWKRRAELELDYSLNTYLSAAVKYEVINRLAARNRQKAFRTHISHNWQETQQETENYIRFNELQKQLHSLVNALPERCRVVYRLSRDKGYSQRRIAQELGISEKTVETHLSVAIRKLKTGLSHLFHVLFFLFP
jgi:RNA polymerase sigma-70 factor (family 1)